MLYVYISYICYMYINVNIYKLCYMCRHMSIYVDRKINR